MKKIGKSGLNVYNGWRQRKILPRADQLYLICKTLNVPMEYFFDDAPSETERDKILKKINSLSQEELTILSNMTEEQLKKIINFAASI